jgi:hypothetical protein
MFICVLFAFLSVNLLGHFLRTGHVTGLLLLASEVLVVALTVVRRRTTIVDRSPRARVTTAVSVTGPLLLRATEGGMLVRDDLTAIVSATGLLLVIAGKIALGRSFGIAPANRGVVVRGPYAFMRHPIYTGYVITHVAFLASNMSLWNAGLLLVADSALVIRSLCEERVLKKDAAYRQYCRRVAWHLVPGVY